MKTLLLSLVLFSPLSWAQDTIVTGTVTDPTGLAYSNGTINATLVISGTPLFSSGLPYTPPSQPTGLSSSGSFTMSLADVTQILPSGGTWSFHVCSAGGTVQPGSPITNGPVCFDVTGIVISGAAQNISATLSAAAPRLTSPASGGASAAPPVNSVQINVAGAFAGFAQHQYSNSAFGVTGNPAISLRSDGAAPSNAMIDIFSNATLGATPASAINLNFVPTLVGTSSWSEIRFGDPTSTATGVNVAWSIGSTGSITAPSEWGIYMNAATPTNLSHRIAGRLGLNTSVSTATVATAESDALTGLTGLQVVGENTDTFNIFTGIENFAGNAAFQIDGGGHVGSQNTPIAVTGAGCTRGGNSNDTYGYVVLSAGASTCTLTFANTHFETGAKNMCTVTAGASGQNPFVNSTPGLLFFSFATAIQSGNVYYHCFWER